MRKLILILSSVLIYCSNQNTIKTYTEKKAKNNEKKLENKLSLTNYGRISSLDSLISKLGYDEAQDLFAFVYTLCKDKKCDKVIKLYKEDDINAQLFLDRLDIQNKAHHVGLGLLN